MCTGTRIGAAAVFVALGAVVGGQAAYHGGRQSWAEGALEAPMASAQPGDVTQTLSGILDDFHDAASKADYARYFAHWSPVSVFLGTDATERWVGAEFREYAKKRFDTGKGWTYRSHDRHVTLAPDGEHAFF